MSVSSTKLPIIHFTLPAQVRAAKQEKKKSEKCYVQLTGELEKTLFFLSQFGRRKEPSGRVYLRIG